MITRTSSSRLPERAPETARCARNPPAGCRRPAFAARCMKKSPAQTRHSLLAKRHRRAAVDRGQCAGFNPAAPLTAAITQSAGRAAASMIALSPAPHSMPVPASASFNSPSRDGVGDRRKSRAEFAWRVWPALRHWNSRSAPSTRIAVARAAAANPWCCRRSSRWRPAPSRCARLPPRALLLRNGTALIVSPNHKTAADAIGATPQKAEKGRHDDGCDKSIQAIH